MLLRTKYTVTALDLDLPLTVSPSMVSPTRRIIEAKLGPVLEDEDAIFRVAMTAHELLENAAKYASDGKARLELSVTPRDEGAIVRVVVTNNSTREQSPSLAPATPR
jgi:two-component sensor histidine kinase